MQKVFNADILDIFPTEKGFVYACKQEVDGQEAAGFFSYDIKADVFERISVKKYIEYKYGEDEFHTAKNLGDFVTCRPVPISATENAASFKDGTLKIFDNNGIVLEVRKALYQGCPAVSPELVGRDIWMAVPEANAIINYSVKYNRIEFRIGGPKEKAFAHPVDVVEYDNYLYVSNASSFKIRSISLTDYTINDYYLFHEPVYRYFRSNDKEFVVLDSGVYTI